MMPGAYSFPVFRTWVHAYKCMSICTHMCTYVRDPVGTQVKVFVPGRT